MRRELDAKDAGALVEAGGQAYLPLIHAAGPFEEAATRLDAFDTGGALDSRIEALRAIAARVEGPAGLTLDPSERHGFGYQSWFGFTLYAEGVRCAMGRGGTYLISGSDEPATGFSLYPEELVEAVKADEDLGEKLFLPLGHDRALAAYLREEGWRTVAALDEADDGAALGCTHVLLGEEVRAL